MIGSSEVSVPVYCYMGYLRFMEVTQVDEISSHHLTLVTKYQKQLPQRSKRKKKGDTDDTKNNVLHQKENYDHDSNLCANHFYKRSHYACD